MKTQLFALILAFQFLFIFSSWAQDVLFQNQVEGITAEIDSKGWSKGSIIFTGSSSVKLWKSLEETFPEKDIINTGFGGSTAPDLFTHLFPLVLRFEPSKVFIYEGDNDINNGTEASEIMIELDKIVKRITELNSEAKVYLISAKPSPSRWSLKSNYEALNQLMKEYGQTNERVEFVDVWTPMLDENGKPIPDIFIEDDLHMNEKGYEIWNEVIAPFLKN